MTRDEMIEVLNAIKNPVKEVAIINRMMDELGIPYKPTKCPKCIRDRYLILKEELGLIESAAELSEWNEGCKYEYVHHRTVIWKGNKMNQHTPVEVIRQFFESVPEVASKYYRVEQE